MKATTLEGCGTICRIIMILSLAMFLIAMSGCDAISNKVKCRDCGGSGDCRVCGGDGYWGIIPCCETGECSTCNGYGYTFDTE